MTAFRLPPVTTNHEGRQRRTGFEIEYAGVDLQRSAQIVAGITGGKIETDGPYRVVIRDGRHGDYVVEVDASLLQNQSYEKYLQQGGIDIDKLDMRAPLEDLIKSLAATMVPNEIVSPPIPLDEMSIMDDIRAGLAQSEGRGTEASIIYGFGVHMNPELPDTDADTLLSFLRAFALCHDWISGQSKVNWTRRIGPYINPWPAEYIRLILPPEYQPDRDQLIADYVKHIPSRNHALDMLPVFTWLQGDELLEQLQEPELNKPRPTFHYRLPNCMLDDPDWRIAREWNYWVAIEELANNPGKLAQLAQTYRRQQQSWWRRLLARPWAQTVARALDA